MLFGVGSEPAQVAAQRRAIEYSHTARRLVMFQREAKAAAKDSFDEIWRIASPLFPQISQSSANDPFDFAIEVIGIQLREKCRFIGNRPKAADVTVVQ